MQSKAKTVKEYLAGLTPERRAAINTIRGVILKNLQKGFEEGMQYGGIGYWVPHSIYPAGYHCDPSQPLCFAGLASQKNYMSLYLMCVYADSDYSRWLEKAWKSAGKKLDMGKCCIRFKRLEDVPLEVVGEAFRKVSVKDYLEFYESALEMRKGNGGTERWKKRATTGPAKKEKLARVKKTGAKKKTAATRGA